MIELGLNLLKENLIKSRELLEDKDYLFFDKMFEEKQKLLLEKMYMPVLLNGLSDSSLEFSYTSDLLNLIRAFHPIIGNDSFLKMYKLFIHTVSTGIIIY